VVGPRPPASACRCCSNGRFPPGPPTTGRCAPGYASSRRSARAGGSPPSRGPRPGLGARLPVRPDRRRADLEASARRRRVHREALAIECGRRIDSDATVAVLDGLVAQRGAAPEHIRCDNGPELTANALRDWCRFSRAHSAYIEPGSPTAGRLRADVGESAGRGRITFGGCAQARRSPQDAPPPALADRIDPKRAGEPDLGAPAVPLRSPSGLVRGTAMPLRCVLQPTTDSRWRWTDEGVRPTTPLRHVPTGSASALTATASWGSVPVKRPYGSSTCEPSRIRCR